MTDEEQWRNDIVEAHPYSGAGLDLDQIITRGQHRARRKRNMRRGASLVGVVVLIAFGGLLVKHSLAESNPSAVRTAGNPHRHAKKLHATPTTTTSSTMTVTPTTAPATTTPATSAPPSTTPETTTPPVGPPVSLPVAVQSDAEMQAAGNNGPSSSILAPTSCEVTGGQVTARGGYTDGGFAPNVYNRFGAMVKLYVYSAPAPGFGQGVQLISVGEETAAPIGGYGPWEVSGPIYVTSSAPVRCVVASQPTHDFVGAPN